MLVGWNRKSRAKSSPRAQDERIWAWIEFRYYVARASDALRKMLAAWIRRAR
jgi:hypothetical protein